MSASRCSGVTNSRLTRLVRRAPRDDRLQVGARIAQYGQRPGLSGTVANFGSELARNGQVRILVQAGAREGHGAAGCAHRTSLSRRTSAGNSFSHGATSTSVPIAPTTTDATGPSHSAPAPAELDQLV